MQELTPTRHPCYNGRMKHLKPNTFVLIEWWDITADLHTDKPLEPVLAEVSGWVVRSAPKTDRLPAFIELATCRYFDGCDCMDRIAIPKGCIKQMQVL